MHARILWTYSAAYRLFGKDCYRKMADRAYFYFRDYFIDRVYGGVFWELDYLGNPVNPKNRPMHRDLLCMHLPNIIELQEHQWRWHMQKNFFIKSKHVRILF
ncbi:hypothetical protein [Sphingobacterium sp. IITKGP-BTPF85]|uniref:hypothetical protein n=1 Tax=Sphingobacterium sp. IITKGP-BTPF85 TaxID=1338009 RepID=UPI0021D20DE8